MGEQRTLLVLLFQQRLEFLTNLLLQKMSERGFVESFLVQSSYIFGTPVEAADTQCNPLHNKLVMAAACPPRSCSCQPDMTVARYTIHGEKEKENQHLKAKQKPPLRKTSDRRIGLLNVRVDWWLAQSAACSFRSTLIAMVNFSGFCSEPSEGLPLHCHQVP